MRLTALSHAITPSSAAAASRARQPDFRSLAEAGSRSRSAVRWTRAGSASSKNAASKAYLPSYALASAVQTACVAAYPLLGDGASLLALSAVFGFGFAGNMTCLVLCVRDLVPASRFGGALGVVMLVAWAGMGVGGYAGGLLFDLTLSYSLPFMLAGLAGLLNLFTIGTLFVMRRLPGGSPQGSPAAAAI